MSWTVTHNGQKHAIPDGRDFTMLDRVPLPEGGWRMVRTVYHPNGTRDSESQEYPAGALWTNEGDALPPDPPALNIKPPSKEDRMHMMYMDSGTYTGRTNAPGPPLTYKGAPLTKDMYKQEYQRKIIESPYISNKEPEMKTGNQGLPTGLRVSFRAQGDGGPRSGTVINLGRDSSQLPRGVSLICSDDPVDHFQDFTEYTGSRHGIVANNKHISPFADQNRAKAWAGVPDHVGVRVRENFRWDQVTFEAGQVGRVMQFDDDQVTIAWYHLRNDSFRISGAIAHPKTGELLQYQHCYSVPLDHLSWVLLDHNQGVVQVWPGLFSQSPPKFKEGDYVVYVNPKATRVQHERNYAVAQGAILKIMSSDGPSRCYTAVLVSGCDEKARNLQIRLEHHSVALLEFPYIEEGQRIEIVASVEFKKRELQGRRGAVILPTDADGDVGIQFNEDIGAGSLDGAGKNRHCLYVSADAIKKTSR